MRRSATRGRVVWAKGATMTDTGRGKDHLLGELQERLRRYQELTSNIEETVWTTDATGEKVLFASTAFEKIWGYAPEEIRRRPSLWLDAVCEADRKRVAAAFFDACGRWREGLAARFEVEYRIIRPDGGRRWIRDRGFPVLDEHGVFARVVGIAVDITERKRAELETRDLNHYLDAIIAHLPVGIAILEGEDFRYFRINRALAELNGLSIEDHLGKTVAEVIPESSAIVRNLRQVREARRVSRQREFTIRLPKHPGQDLHLMDFHFPIEVDGEVKAIGAVVLDITARKESENQLRKAHDELELRVAERTAELERANKALRDREQQLRLITDNIPALIAYVDSDRRYGFVNRPFSERFGRRPEDVLGKSIEKIMGQADYGKIARRVNGALIGERQTFSKTSALPDGKEEWLSVSYIPDRDPQGKVQGFYVLMQDVTELKTTQAQLIQAGRLVAVGELGAGIAHELNQPLAALQMFAEMMSAEPDRRVGDFSEELELIAEQHRRMAKIVDNIRAFARQSNFIPEAVDPRDALDQALMLVSERLRLAGVEVVREVGESLPSIHADGAKLQQVFLNLLSNALHALETMPSEAPKSILLRLCASAGDEMVEYVVEDNGPGVPEELVGRIFDPFFTTKEAGKGTGLGLSLVYGIIREHSGEVRYEHANEGGARFVVRVPVTSGSVQASPETAEPEGSKISGRVLIVDDERVLRIALGKLLTHDGWQVVTAASGAEALLLLAESCFDILLLDLKMPGLSGQETCRLAKEKWPEMPVIVMSGYVSKEDAMHLVGHLGVAEVLPKPVSKSVLRESLRRALDNNSGEKQTS